MRRAYACRYACTFCQLSPSPNVLDACIRVTPQARDQRPDGRRRVRTSHSGDRWCVQQAPLRAWASRRRRYFSLMVRARRRQRGLSVAATALPSAVAVAVVSAISKADDLQLTHASSICLTRQVLSNDDKCHLRLYKRYHWSQKYGFLKQTQLYSLLTKTTSYENTVFQL